MIQENEYIKPVENLHNVGALAPIDKHPEKRRRQGQKRQSRSTPGKQDLSDNRQDQTTAPDNEDTIDYRA